MNFGYSLGIYSRFAYWSENQQAQSSKGGRKQSHRHPKRRYSRKNLVQCFTPKKSKSAVLPTKRRAIGRVLFYPNALYYRFLPEFTFFSPVFMYKNYMLLPGFLKKESVKNKENQFLHDFAIR